MVYLYLHLHSQMTSDSKVCLYEVSEEVRAAQVQEGGSWKILRQATRLCYAMKAKEPRLSYDKIFFDHVTPNIWLPNAPACNSPDNNAESGVKRKPHSNKISCSIKDELNAKIMAAFINLIKGNGENYLQEISKSTGSHGLSR